MEKDQAQYLNQSQTIISTNAEKHQTNNKTADKSKGKKNRVVFSPDDWKILAKFISSFASEQLPAELVKERTQFIREKVTTLNHKNLDAFSETIKQSLINGYHQKLEVQTPAKVMIESIKTYEQIVKMYRDCSVNPTIIVSTYQQFKGFWKVIVEKNKNELISLLFPIWKSIPHQLLRQFLQQFHLLKQFQTIDPKTFFTFLSSGLFDNKIQQNCQYYRLYKQGRNFSAEEQEKFDDFEYDQIIPRITKKDQIFSEHVIELIKTDDSIAKKVFEALSIRQYQKIVYLTQKDVKDHPRIVKHAMKKHYKDIVRKMKSWYVIEDKICYCSQFIEWFIKDIAKQFQLKEQKQEVSEEDNSSGSEKGKITFGISSEKEAMQIIQSLRLRAGLGGQKTQSYIENPLYSKDDYTPTQLILSSLEPSEKQFEKGYYLSLQLFNFSKEQIVFVDKIDEVFQKAVKSILSAELVGFDSQFWATASKYENSSISIIQLSLEDVCYIFDYHELQEEEQFNAFFKTFMDSENIVKVGHTISSDLQYLYKTFKKPLDIKSFLDLAKLLKRLYPHEVMSSLAFMTDKFVGKRMCKYQQRGNWSRRPLKKTQLTYAAIDARVCTTILLKMLEEKQLTIQEMIQLANEGKIESKQNSNSPLKKDGPNQETWKPQLEFDFKKFSQYTQNPIFLVDNMLKKLCSTMRNCGIDTQFISVKDYDLAASQAKKEKRIFITRDTKLLIKRFSNIPIYLLKERSDSDIMFKELVKVFSLDLSTFKTLSRCVKCNNPELIVITAEEAKKQINFIYEDSEITEFWRCSQCKQIYWEGGQFKKAKNKYDELRK